MQYNESIIPEKFKELFESLLKSIENETNDIYQITVTKFGNTIHNYIIGEFSKRHYDVEVYQMNSQFIDLNGIYRNINDVKNKIQLLRTTELFEEVTNYADNETIKIGKCRKCHKVVMSIFAKECNNCSEALISKWDGLLVEDNGSIYNEITGQIVGKYKFLFSK